MSNVDLIKITKGAYSFYTKYVKNNQNETWLHVRKKMTRNWIMGEFVKEDSDEEYEHRIYGNLHMWLHKKDNRIVWLNNIRGVKTNFYIDMDKKAELEKELGLL